MVDRFDPNLLRFDLLRRVAQSQVPPGEHVDMKIAENGQMLPTFWGTWAINRFRQTLLLGFLYMDGNGRISMMYGSQTIVGKELTTD